MKLTSMHVYCAFINIKEIVNNKKTSIDKYNIYRYRASQDHLKDQCKRIYNEIENNMYSFNDYRRFLVYCYLFQSSFGFGEVHKKSMYDFKKMFSYKTLKQDEEIILLVNKEVKYNDVKKFFRIVNGRSMIYNLIQQKIISPLFWIKYNKFFVDDPTEVEDHKRFRKICSLFKLIN